MRNKKFRTWLTLWLLTVGLCLGGVGSFVTCLNLQPVNLGKSMLWCILFTAGWSALCFVRRGWIYQLCITALAAGYILRSSDMMLQLEALIYRISAVYDREYGCGVIMWSGEYLPDVPIEASLTVLACLLGAGIGCLLKKPKLNFWAATLGALPLMACMPITESAPGGFWLWLLLSGLLLVVLTGMVRCRSQADGVRLMALLLVPVCLFTLLLQSFCPKKDYEHSAKGLDQTILSWLQDLPFVVEGPDGLLQISFGGTTSDYVSLRNAGPKVDLGYAVMDVVSSVGGALYLREQSFAVYDGTAWSAGWNSAPAEGWPRKFTLKKTGSISISTRTLRQELFVPYYGEWTLPEVMHMGKVPNEESLREYTMDLYELRAAELHKALSYAQKQNHTQLPWDSRAGLKLHLEKAGINANAMTQKEIAERVCEYVKNSAEYSLDTPKMDEEAEDFALWFLDESDTGYCVHFATAATALLRVAGIPARYVTGYVCNAVEGQRVTVTADQAHAWVEYYSDDLGCWVVMEPTPGFAGQNVDINDPGQETVPQPTTPGATEPTEPSVPTEPTEPEATTEPTQPEPTEEPTQPTDATTPDDPTKPTEQGGAEGPGTVLVEGNPLLWRILAAVLLIFAIVGALVGQYALRRRCRVRKMTEGDANQRALAMWQEVRRYVRLLKCPMPKDMRALAEKAKFSQHTLTGEELEQMEVWLEKARKKLSAKPLPVRWLWKLIWAVK